MIWKKNEVTFPNGNEWTSKQKWLAVPDPQGHEDTVRYLTYGCAFRLVDGVDKRYQTYHADPDTYPTVWVCMCTRKCMSYFDISEKNTTPRDEYLKNAHKLERQMEHDKKGALWWTYPRCPWKLRFVRIWTHWWAYQRKIGVSAVVRGVVVCLEPTNVVWTD
jgi:hypothetical protein